MQDTDLPEKIEPTSLNLQTELAAQLAELVPEAMSDGKLDVTKLRELVNGDAENSPEKFGIFWPGKRAAQALAQIPTTATLVPAPDESVDWDTTKNIFIEGDNLEVLKALQNSYRRKVKMIYIDPPYNTGKEFIYPDKFSEGLQGYLEYTGQKNEAGENVESKPETGGRKHSNWLSMMYPRLQLAKSLLTDDGVIFISIDDNEQANLKKLCDEVFGEDNFVAVFSWKSKLGKVGTTSTVSTTQEYILCYARNITDAKFKMIETSNEGRRENLRQWGQADRREDRPSMYYPITINGITVYPKRTDGTDGRWRIGKENADQLLDEGLLELSKKDGEYSIYRIFKPGISVTPHGTSLDSSLGTTAKGSLTLKSIGMQQYFDYPKPIELIKFFVELVTSESDIVLDFFSGSGTSAHSVMQSNVDDGGTRLHIQVQLPELTNINSEAYKAGYKTIADISKERIRRAGKKIHEDFADKIAQRSTPLDIGFRVYKLAPSNFVQWDENKAKDDIQQSVLDFAANKKPDAAPESLLTEIMLQARMPLSANIEKRDLQNGGWVYVVDGGNLIAYVADEQITEAQANEIADLAPAKLIVLDSAFNGNNALKINVMNICKEKFIKEFKTI